MREFSRNLTQKIDVSRFSHDRLYYTHAYIVHHISTREPASTIGRRRVASRSTYYYYTIILDTVHRHTVIHILHILK
ncbi:hypothetical protein TSAR_002817 [Trichomalopsis sarcophagae]|uniref:Uncharacterized protein n=1 Tax=Trichomalopsis sarcophagae TaxID=543379 RepID=A0A232F3J6_9HYME|nr:hypothetical protein TSAR_002817 [Trichomalopsis sarcophagae]